MSKRSIRNTVTVTNGITFIEGPASNWIILTGPHGVDVIDAGYPADAPLVIESLKGTGASLADLRRIWVTHDHTDHVGGIPALLRAAPHASVLTDPEDLLGTRGIDREQVTVRRLGLRLVMPRWSRWALTAARSGGLQDITIPTARAFGPTDFELGLEPLHLPGHTNGSTAFLLDGGRTVVTGDVVVTSHPTLRRQPSLPQAIDPVFSHSPELAGQAAKSLIESPVQIVLPGHGPAMTRTIEGWASL